MDRLPGFRDFYPEPLPNQDVWSADGRAAIFARWRDAAQRYGFREYDGPPLEPLDLYTLKSGEEIVGQLYHFVDKGDRKVALRPEITPTLARMAAAHERNYKKPFKWFSIPQLFRYEKQQRGRLREHFQFNADIIGEAGPAVDAELIALLIDSLRAFGLTSEDFVLRLSSRQAWEEFYAKRGGDPASAPRFFQIVDKLEREPPDEIERRLQALGVSFDDVREFIRAGEATDELKRIEDELESRGLGAFVRVDYGVIRGLAYYTGPVFEAFDRQGELRAIAGGGRYDNLLKLVSRGKSDLPSVGFGMGDVVLSELLKTRHLFPNSLTGPDWFVMVENEELRGESLRLAQKLRDAGARVELALGPMGANKQFKRARELNAARTARLDRSDDGSLSVAVKDLNTREEDSLPIDALVERVSRSARAR